MFLFWTGGEACTGWEGGIRFRLLFSFGQEVKPGGHIQHWKKSFIARQTTFKTLRKGNNTNLQITLLSKNTYIQNERAKYVCCFLFLLDENQSSFVATIVSIRPVNVDQRGVDCYGPSPIISFQKQSIVINQRTDQQMYQISNVS